ncbi:hypothetical protein LCGC14_1892830, partial [marine sediment metagenome]
ETNIPNGEKWLDFTRRVSKAFNQITTLNYETIAVVSHAGVIRAYIASVLNLRGLDMFYFQIDNGSISVATIFENEVKIDLHFSGYNPQS